MTSNDDNAALYTLGDRGQTVDRSVNDVRGREVKDKDGEGIGKVADLLIDDRENKVRFLLVEHGGFLGFGQTKTLIPVDAVTKVTEDSVFIDQSRDHAAGAPGYDPDLVDDRPYHSSIYGYYGYAPYWGQGYSYPMGLQWGMRPAMTDPDVTSVIAEQHEETKQALRGLLGHRGDERADLFRKLRVTMALHETAEELTVHPEAMRQLGGNDRSIRDRVAEESDAGELIGRLELLDIDSDAFGDGFEELASSVIRHAQSEEADEWPALREITDMAAIERMVAVMSAVPGLAEDPHGLARDAIFSQMLGWAEQTLADEVPSS